MSTVQTLYPAGTVTITISAENQTSSSPLSSGIMSDAISNVSNLDVDHLVSGTWTSGTSPTATRQVQVWVVPCLTDDLAGTVTWPDGLTLNAVQSWKSPMMVLGAAKIGTTLVVDGPSDLTYDCASFSVAALFGGSVPTTYALFITQNTTKASNATAGNFVWKYQRLRVTA